MKKIISGITLSSLLAGGLLLPTAAHANQNIDGSATNSNSADVSVNGYLGQDNTDPGGEIPGGSDEWINVTLPTATIFYTLKNKTEIESPNYKITNLSGRPVNVSVNQFTQTSGTNGDVETLSLVPETANAIGGNAQSLISESTIQNSFGTPFMVLANNQGKQFSSDNENTYAKELSFGFTGQAVAEPTTDPVYNLNLKFSVNDNF